MPKLSVNINKFATLRNARGGNNPDLVKIAIDCQRFGADGITVHPRPDERHIRYQDVYEINQIIDSKNGIEFNIEGNPMELKFVDLVLASKPTQVTLVPDSTHQLTSNHGWDTIKNKDFLKEIIDVFKKAEIRVSIFVDPVDEMIQHAKDTGTDRIELYTEAYAVNYINNKEAAVQPYIQAALIAKRIGLEINAGHDLDMNNLTYFSKNIPNLNEVSIGHALVCDALYLGLENAIQMYKRCLK